MSAPSADAIDAAARRLRGQLVAAPLLGDLRLDGFPAAGDLRLSLELLQPGGSLAYRGALHQLLRQLGGCKGLVLSAPPHQLASMALAAATQRQPFVAVPTAPADARLQQELLAIGCELAAPGGAEAARLQARRLGYALVDGTGEDFAAGVATLGRELAAVLPADTACLLTPPPFAAALAAGLAAGGRSIPVREVPLSGAPPGLHEALLHGHRLAAGPAGLCVLTTALGVPGVAAAILAD